MFYFSKDFFTVQSTTNQIRSKTFTSLETFYIFFFGYCIILFLLLSWVTSSSFSTSFRSSLLSLWIATSCVMFKPYAKYYNDIALRLFTRMLFRVHFSNQQRHLLSQSLASRRFFADTSPVKSAKTTFKISFK